MTRIPKRTRWLALGGMALLLAALACGPSGPSPTPAPLPTNTEAAMVTPTTSPSAPPAQPTEGGPPPEVTTEAGCTLNASYVADVTIPDDTEFPAGASFTKTWRMRNSGTCAWEAGTAIVFSSGERMGGPDAAPVGAVSPGATVDISVNLTAPAAPGTYRGYWQLQAPDGTRFGTIVYVQIVVPEPATETPTPAVTPSASECVDPDPALEPILNHAEDLGYDLGCPTAPAFDVSGAFQEFWANVDDVNPHTHFRSLMIWRSDEREIYVIDGEDTDASQGNLLAYTDFWEEGQDEVPPGCAAMTVPTGYQLPIRGFGKIWCENNLVDAVGWPAMHEAAVSLRIQPMQTGLLLKVSGPISPGYLIALDYRAVYAVTQMAAP